MRGELTEVYVALARARQIEAALRHTFPAVCIASLAGRAESRPDTPRRARPHPLTDGCTAAPRFSVLTPVGNPPPAQLRACLASVRAQTLGDWEHVLAVDRSTPARIAKLLAKAAAPIPASASSITATCSPRPPAN